MSQWDPAIESVADIVSRLGDIPLDRILTQPPLGTAREEDLLRRSGDIYKICELIDGVLVVKATGIYKSALGCDLGSRLLEFAQRNKLGFVLGTAGPYRLAPGLIRKPDVSFVSWRTFGDRRLADCEVADFPPDLAIDLLTPQNTQREMQRKRREYFTAGVRSVWLVDLADRGAWVCDDPDRDARWHGLDDSLSGGEILPGFTLSVREWLQRFD